MPADQPAIDPANVAELRGLPDEEGHDLLARLAGMFREDAPPVLDELGVAVERGDFQAIGRLAHSLKGSSAYFGAHHFQSLCVEAEMAGRAGQLAPISELLPAIRAELHRVFAALEAEIARA
jgi:HPt (histidine-containing phosphotransfer) domain-containing protein